MPLELVYSGQARADLERILRHIADNNPSAARHWLAAIEDRCEKLRSFPEMGVSRPDLSADIRIFPFRRSVIAYRIQTDRIRIVRELYGGRDYSVLNEP